LNCNCLTIKDHLRELQKDHEVIFNRVCNGSNELNSCIEISNEILEYQNKYDNYLRGLKND